MNGPFLSYSPLYRDTLLAIRAGAGIEWETLRHSSLLLSGGTGQIGSHLIDALMYMNREAELDCRIKVLTRSPEKARERFSHWIPDGKLSFIRFDFSQNDVVPETADAEYVIHLASNTHPLAYAARPIETVMVNVSGTAAMLDTAVRSRAKTFLLASSNEIYGENRGDTELFTEDYAGYIDCNTLRAGYPESKRCAEALCRAYGQEKGLVTVVARLTRTYGPTLLRSDTKAMSQFLFNGACGKDIVLKSDGTQCYSYTYVTDAVSGLLTVLTRGRCGEAYNIAEESFDMPLRDMAGIVARESGVQVKYDVPSKLEASGYSVVTKARLSGEKVRALGWKAFYPCAEGIRTTLKIWSR